MFKNFRTPPIFGFTFSFCFLFHYNRWVITFSNMYSFLHFIIENRKISIDTHTYIQTESLCLNRLETICSIRCNLWKNYYLS